MNGYIVRNKDGDYLTRDLFWFSHESPEEAYVHMTVTFDCKDWESKPSEIIPATYENDVVAISGKPQRFE